MNKSNFDNTILKRCSKKQFKVSNSNGIREAWRWMRKNKWPHLSQPITELQLGIIVKTINEHLQGQLLEFKDVKFPYNMGRIELLEYKPRLYLEGDKIKTNLPVNWRETLNLWKESASSYKNKTLVRKEYNRLYKIYFNKRRAVFKHRQYYKFIPTRSFKSRIAQYIKDNKIDTFIIK